MVAPFSHDEIIILGGINKNLMKLGNGIILNTTNMTATRIKTNKKIFFGQIKASDIRH